MTSVYVVMSVGSGEIARVCSKPETAKEFAQTVQDGVWKLAFEVIQMDVDGPTNRKIIYSTLNEG